MKKPKKMKPFKARDVRNTQQIKGDTPIVTADDATRKLITDILKQILPEAVRKIVKESMYGNAVDRVERPQRQDTSHDQCYSESASQPYNG